MFVGELARGVDCNIVCQLPVVHLWGELPQEDSHRALRVGKAVLSERLLHVATVLLERALHCVRADLDAARNTCNAHARRIARRVGAASDGANPNAVEEVMLTIFRGLLSSGEVEDI